MNQTVVSGFSRNCPGNNGFIGSSTGQYLSFWFSLPELSEADEGKYHIF